MQYAANIVYVPPLCCDYITREIFFQSKEVNLKNSVLFHEKAFTILCILDKFKNRFADMIVEHAQQLPKRGILDIEHSSINW